MKTPFTIIINGTGEVANPAGPTAANLLGAQCVDALRAAGHDIGSATFQYGVLAENIAPGSSVYPPAPSPTPASPAPAAAPAPAAPAPAK